MAGKANNDTKTNDVFDPFGFDDETIVDKTTINAFDSFTVTFTEKSDNDDDDNDEQNNISAPPSPPTVSRVSRKGIIASLPPKLNVKLAVHEEASAIASTKGQGCSEVTIEGTVQAQVQCSDAMKNAPFKLNIMPSVSGGKIKIFPNGNYFLNNDNDNNNNKRIVNIPKHEIGLVHVANYTYTNIIQHMPLLLERKVTISNNNISCRIAIQVRSKLTNKGNLENFIIVAAIPDVIDGESIEIVRGNGIYDHVKRTIQWKLAELIKGQSIMVSAQAKLWEPINNNIDNNNKVIIPQVPVMLRCTSTADPISNINFRVTSADGHPSSITYNTNYSFRLLHRLP